jgi:hypothetical protein
LITPTGTPAVSVSARRPVREAGSSSGVDHGV